MYYVMSDIHGCFNEMIQALNHWNKEEETLVILGDLVDRGPDSLAVIQHLMKLQDQHPDRVIIIKGNHDDMLTSWLVDTPYNELVYYYHPNHNETLQSFFKNKKRYNKASRRQRAEHAVYMYKAELMFLKTLPYYYETDHIIFSHAGIDLDAPDWRENTREMLWSRNFPHKKQQTPKKVFFGHTPTPYLHDKMTNYNIWVNKTNDRVCLDGGIAFGGQLNAVKVNTNGDIVDEIIILPNNIKGSE